MGRAQELLHLSVSGQQELQARIGNQASGPKCLENSSFITKIKGISPIWGQFKFSAHTEVCCVSVVLPGAWMSGKCLSSSVATGIMISGEGPSSLESMSCSCLCCAVNGDIYMFLQL